MSTATAPTPLPSAIAMVAGNPEAGHKLRLLLGYILIIALIAGIGAYGFDYYAAGFRDRPFMAKHALLKPSGRIGIILAPEDSGCFGTGVHAWMAFACFSWSDFGSLARSWPKPLDNAVHR